MKEELKKLYQSVILRHNKEPYHYDRRMDADLVVQAYNPVCGDKFTIYLDVEEGRITAAWFHGYGCALSTASTSVLVQRLEGVSLEDFAGLFVSFQQYLEPEAVISPKEKDETFAAFSGVRDFPGRMQCVTLSWEALEEFLRRR